MATRAACPKCRQALTITQAPPIKVKCSNCGAVISLNAPATPRSNEPASSGGLPSASPHRASAMPVAAPAAVRAGEAPLERRPRPVAAPVAEPRTPTKSPSLLPWIIGGAAGVLVLLILIVVLVSSLGGGRKSDGGSADNHSGGDGLIVQPRDVVIPGAGVVMDPRVRSAVDKGVDYLKKRLTGTGELYYFFGTKDAGIGAAALAGLTLLECDVPPDDPAIQQAVGHVRRNVRTLTFSYTLALNILFLDRLCENKKTPEIDKKSYADMIRRMAVQLIAAQQRGGGWGYQCHILSDNEQAQLLNQLKRKTFKAGPQPLASGNRRDNSIAQFVTLALWSARKHDVPVYETLVLEESRYRQQQQQDGSWGYNETLLTARDATTCAGLIGLAVGRGIRDEANTPPIKQPSKPESKVDVKLDPAISKGLLFLSRVVGKKGNISPRVRDERIQRTRTLDELSRQAIEDRSANLKQIEAQIAKLDDNDLATGMLFEADAWGDLYFLWSLERVAMVYALDTIHGKDWYKWGSEIILANQKEDGSWQERFPGAPDTCFALLFLKRVNVVKDLTDKLRTLTAALQLRAPRHPMPLPPLPPGRREA